MGNGTTQKQSVRWHKRLGAYLLAAGLVNDETLSKALEVQRNQNPPKTKIGKLLIGTKPLYVSYLGVHFRSRMPGSYFQSIHPDKIVERIPANIVCERKVR